MPDPIILASGSEIRANLLRNAGVPFTVEVARVDEDAIKSSLLVEGASPRDISDALAEHKARKVSLRNLSAVVIGADQVLDFEGQLLSKPADKAEAMLQLEQLSAASHHLYSAAVVYQSGEPLWRRVEKVKMTMAPHSIEWLTGYVERNWDGIRNCVGAYKIEEEGVRLFSRIEGDYFSVLGLPLLPLLSYLTQRGDLT
jgi:septum formation protein